MRSHGVVHARDGDLELTLGPPPVDLAAAAPLVPEDDERASLEALLYGTGLTPDDLKPRGEPQ